MGTLDGMKLIRGKTPPRHRRYLPRQADPNKPKSAASLGWRFVYVGLSENSVPHVTWATCFAKNLLVCFPYVLGCAQLVIQIVRGNVFLACCIVSNAFEMRSQA